MGRSRLLLAWILLLAGAAPASARRCPNIMYVLDTTESVRMQWGAEVGIVTQTLNALGNRVRFGLTTFASMGGAQNCFQDAHLLVDAALGNGPAIQKALNGVTIGGAVTNTAEAIRRAHMDSVGLRDATRDNFLILITAGTPNCGAPEPSNTIAEIRQAALSNPPLKTFVVGIDGGNGVDPAALNQMAVAGGTPRQGCDPKNPNSPIPCYYSATNVVMLQKVIAEITEGLAGSQVNGLCDDTCFAIPCPAGLLCVFPSTCAPPACKPDPCLFANCAAGTYCKEGRCLTPCPTCGPDEMCVQDKCVPDPCPKALRDQCAGANLVCDRGNARCAPDQCARRMPFCPLPSTCEPVSGCCADDPCRLVNCPPQASCIDGYCMLDPTPDMSTAAPDLTSTRPDLADDGAVPSSSDCSCALGRRAPGTSPLVVLAAALAAVVLRRQRGLGSAARRRRRD